MSLRLLVDTDGGGKVDRFIAEWVQQRIPRCLPFAGAYRCLGICRGDAMIAGAVYTHLTQFQQDLFPQGGGNVYLSLAAESPRWASRETVGIILSLPFRQWGCNRITAIIDRKFSRSRKLSEGVGFRLEGVARQMLPGKRDACIYGLLKEDFLGGRFGPQKQPLAKAA